MFKHDIAIRLDRNCNRPFFEIACLYDIDNHNHKFLDIPPVINTLYLSMLNSWLIKFVHR